MVNGEKDLKIMQTKNFNLDKDRNLIRSWRKEINQIEPPKLKNFIHELTWSWKEQQSKLHHLVLNFFNKMNIHKVTQV